MANNSLPPSLFKSLFGWAVVIAALMVGTLSVKAETVHTIISNGSPHNRIDIAILGDGYTASELAQYHADVQAFIANVFAQEPYREYQRYYNVHLIDMVSAQSGADHPERNPPVFVNTALDATYNCSNIQRLICINDVKVIQAINRSLIPSQFDVVLVLVNDTEYGGSGGTGTAVASKNSAVVELVLHEVGHSFGLLADEYAGGGPACNPNIEPGEPNATCETQRSLIKWNHWIDATTFIPTISQQPGLAGLFPGSKYCETGLYRPTFRSKMHSLGFPFEQINTEQHVKMIYSYVTPLDSSLPSGNLVLLKSDEEQIFSAAKLEPLTHSLSIEWQLDGQTVGNGNFFVANGPNLSLGAHTVRVLIRDNTPFVRNDPLQLLSTSRSWNLNVRPSSSRQSLFDYDGDGRSDLSVKRPADNIWHLLRGTAGYTQMRFGEAGDRLAPADYDADGKTDVAVFRPYLGQWYIFMSASQTFHSVRWGLADDFPVPGDRDGDSMADFVVFRPSTNTWYTRFANGTYAVTQFGVAGDKPVVGDFDADGIGDIALFRPSNNNWYILKSSLGFFIQTWGQAGDIPITGDFDGDGATDQAVFRPSTGQWFRSRTTAGFDALNWGVAGDVPVAADYDGDGKADVAVFRPSNGTWYIINSTAGIQIQQFGEIGDVPTQSSYIY